ncbi:Uncharacterised protein [Suttonella indologenes]|uniref:Uncharacterized protein n=1 Tax=Suttonella indologenes TaxID=13276 RepID=A0A380MLB3_9GAMM|nr:Uncharacterised protein [Suttonella indologenes]
MQQARELEIAQKLLLPMRNSLFVRDNANLSAYFFKKSGLRRFYYVCRSTNFILISAIALAGFNPLGQVLVQFIMV